jgi:WD40-like Beta Propeller Repeat
MGLRAVRVMSSRAGWRCRRLARLVCVAAGLGAGWLVLLVVVASARAAFPGANGLLAVQPRSGGGIVLVAADGEGERRICVASSPCGTPRRPRWSPDGRALVFAGSGISIVYPDGSCMDCSFAAGSSPAFESSGAVISFLRHGRVKVDGMDGVGHQSPQPGSASDAVWSAGGQLAVVREGTIWAGRPGDLSQLAPGAEPSWSPDGGEIAASERGWIVVMAVRGGRVRRLDRGTAPAFSPDGRWIAYVAPNHRLMIVPSSDAHPAPRPVGRIEAASVDWQPLPSGPNPGCPLPPGEHIMASSATAVVSGDGAPHGLGYIYVPPLAYMGCLRADGRERLLERFTGDTAENAYFVRYAVLSTPYAALVLDREKLYGGSQTRSVQVFDLRTGSLQSGLGGERAADCIGVLRGQPFCPPEAFGPLVLGSDGISAVHVQTVDPIGFRSTPLVQVACPTASTLCVALDGTGQALSSVNPSGGAAAWSAPVMLHDNGTNALSCPSTSLCVAVGNTVSVSTDPTGGGSSWTTVNLPAHDVAPDDVSCPSTQLCLVTGYDGSLAVSTDPAGGVGDWRIVKLDADEALRGVFCSSLPECFITESSGNGLSSTDPAGGTKAWKVSHFTPQFVSGTCPTRTLCAAVNAARVFTTTDPSAGLWKRRLIGGLLSIACPSASLCVAVGYDGALELSTHPASDQWTAETIDHYQQLDSISCPSVSLCVVVDSEGHVVTSTDPTGGPSTWKPALVDGDPCNDTTPCTIEQIQASDSTGVRTVDSIKLPGSGPFLTGLKLIGDVLSWNHDGSPRSVVLTP